MGTALIVVDTNLIAYTLLEGPYTPLALRVREKDPEWSLPPLWRHEFLNVLVTYAQHGGLEPAEALAVWGRALKLLAPCEHIVDLTVAFHLAVIHRVSAYDAQFIALAQSLNVLCLTEDRHLLKTFPRLAISMRQFCAE